MRFCFLLFLTLLSPFAHAQILHEQKESALHDILAVLDEHYISAELAKRMRTEMLQHFSSGRYDTISSGKEYAFRLSQDLKEISHDLHLKVEYSEKNIPGGQNSEDVSEEENEDWLNTILVSSNYGISKKEILAGNIGYLNIPLFGPLEKCADTLIAAMEYVSGTDALIIDVRECRGSLDPYTIPFISGYFFEEPVHLIDIYTRKTDKTQQLWSAAWVPGTKYVNKPVYVLTSGRTFSGGEAFAFQLKNAERAIILGDTTRGGGNPTEWMRVNDHFAVTVPFASSHDPETQSGWEQTGVIPHYPFKTQKAFYKAHLMAVKQLYKHSTEAARKEELRSVIEQLENNPPQFRTITFELEGYESAETVTVAGSFNSWERNSTVLQKKGHKWIGKAEVPPGKVSYMFIVDGRWLNDPANPNTERQGEYLNSIMTVE